MVAYATVAQLADWGDGVITSELLVDHIAERASRRIIKAVRQPFDTDDDGQATDATVAEALRDAVCAQVEFWSSVGLAHDVEGLASTQQSVAGWSGTLPPELSPDAVDILMVAGLTQPYDGLLPRTP